MNEELTPSGLVLLAFLLLFSLGMDVYHTSSLESLDNSPAELVLEKGQDRTSAWEVHIEWKSQTTLGGGAFPRFIDTDTDLDGPYLVYSRSEPDSAKVAGQVRPPVEGYTLHRLHRVKKLK